MKLCGQGWNMKRGQQGAKSKAMLIPAPIAKAYYKSGGGGGQDKATHPLLSKTLYAVCPADMQPDSWV